ncbi:hypothetical protein MJO29_002083 [Puccinia striiformis f. sp. tritici]|nr:hypothetical protein MJO29_002083 [Puccinia striiformis f. sp. tritici]
MITSLLLPPYLLFRNHKPPGWTAEDKHHLYSPPPPPQSQTPPFVLTLKVTPSAASPPFVSLPGHPLELIPERYRGLKAMINSNPEPDPQTLDPAKKQIPDPNP